MRHYCTIGKTAHVFKIFYLTMKDHLFGAFGSSTRNSVESIKCRKIFFNTMDYTSHNHWIPGLSQTGVGNSQKNLLKTCVLHTSNFTRTIKIAFNQLQLINMFQTVQS